MYFGKKQHLDWTFALIVGDVAACLLAEPAAACLMQHVMGEIPPTPWPTGWIFLLLVLGIGRHLNLYNWPSFRRPLATLPRITLAVTLATACFAILFQIFGSPWEPSRTSWLASLLVCTIILLFVVRQFVYVLLARILHAVQIERIAFVGGSVRLDRVLAELSQEMGKFHEPVGYFSDAPLEDKKDFPYR